MLLDARTRAWALRIEIDFFTLHFLYCFTIFINHMKTLLEKVNSAYANNRWFLKECISSITTGGYLESRGLLIFLEDSLSRRILYTASALPTWCFPKTKWNLTQSILYIFSGIKKKKTTPKKQNYNFRKSTEMQKYSKFESNFTTWHNVISTTLINQDFIFSLGKISSRLWACVLIYKTMTVHMWDEAGRYTF